MVKLFLPALAIPVFFHICCADAFADARWRGDVLDVRNEDVRQDKRLVVDNER